MRNEKWENVKEENKKGNVISLELLKVIEPSSNVYSFNTIYRPVVLHSMQIFNVGFKEKGRHEKASAHSHYLHAFMLGHRSWQTNDFLDLVVNRETSPYTKR